jgi:hypothetical protein
MMPGMDWKEIAEKERLEADLYTPAPPIAIATNHARNAAIALPDTDDVRELARAATPQAIRALVEIVQDDDATDNARIAAATALLDRAHGKPHQSTTIQGGMTFNLICAIPSPPNSVKTIEHEHIIN